MSKKDLFETIWLVLLCMALPVVLVSCVFVSPLVWGCFFIAWVCCFVGTLVYFTF